MADPITPLHAAKIASKVYSIKSVGISRALLADAEGLGLRGLGLTKLLGRYGFGYVSPGESNRVGEHIGFLRLFEDFRPNIEAYFSDK